MRERQLSLPSGKSTNQLESHEVQAVLRSRSRKKQKLLAGAGARMKFRLQVNINILKHNL
jgi:hypothetical protein